MTQERRPWTILVLLAVAQFMVILDITVVNVALPSIGRDLDFAPADLQWVVTARAARGLGAALLSPAALSLVTLRDRRIRAVIATARRAARLGWRSPGAWGGGCWARRRRRPALSLRGQRGAQ